MKRRHVCDIPGCLAAGPHPSVGPIPTDTDLAVFALRTEEAVVETWNRHPYSILVPTGIVCDVLEMPESVGLRLLAGLRRRQLVGLVGRHQGLWSVFTAAGPRVESEEIPTGGNQVILHGRGSWVTVPPSLLEGRRVDWLIPPPTDRRWWLPRREDVLAVLNATSYCL